MNEAPAHVIPPSRHDQAKAARGARLWTWIARITGLALLAAVPGFGFYLAAANAGQHAERAELITQLDDGPPPSAADVLSVVGPQGPAGPAGTNGLDGMNRISVTGVSCVVRDDLSTAFRFTFSNGATADVAGACLP